MGVRLQFPFFFFFGLKFVNEKEQKAHKTHKAGNTIQETKRKRTTKYKNPTRTKRKENNKPQPKTTKKQRLKARSK